MFSRAWSNLGTARRILTPGFWSLTLTVCINDKAMELMSVNGDSMSPTLSPRYHETGDRDFILIKKWRPAEGLQKGDVVSFHTPLKPETLGIKRVVAMEGEWVSLDWRRRPKELDEGVWDKGLVWESIGEKREAEFGKRRVRVPLGHVWVEGDNALKSYDSNWYGPISKSLIQGKAICVIYPFDRFGAKPWEGYKSKTKVKKDPHFMVEEWEDIMA